jgi:hypothetical protein
LQIVVQAEVGEQQFDRLVTVEQSYGLVLGCWLTALYGLDSG